MKLIAFAATASILAMTSPALAQPVPTETFEAGAPTFTFDTTGGNVGIADGNVYSVCCGTDPADTNKFVAFGGGGPGSGTLSTSFRTALGRLYTVAFDYAALGGGSEALNFSINGTQLFSVSPTAQNQPISFTNGSFTFTGFSGFGPNTTLSISSTGTFGVDAIIDNLSVSGAVPEPATWALMILGFGAVGGAMRRRAAMRTTVAYA